LFCMLKCKIMKRTIPTDSTSGAMMLRSVIDDPKLSTALASSPPLPRPLHVMVHQMAPPHSSSAACRCACMHAHASSRTSCHRGTNALSAERGTCVRNGPQLNSSCTAKNGERHLISPRRPPREWSYATVAESAVDYSNTTRTRSHKPL